MQRRGFLTGLTAGTIGWVVGGRLTGTVPDVQRAYANPVRFVSAAEAAGNNAAFVVDSAKTARLARATFPQSVASGDPNPNGVVIWTRIDANVFNHGGKGSVAWQIASTENFSDGTILLAGLADVTPAADHTVKLPLQNKVLQPFTKYYYRFIYNGVSSNTGRFKTLPLPGDTLSRLKIGYVVCQDYSNGFYNAYGFLAQEEVDVVLFLGDYIYEYLNDGVGGPNNGPVRVVPDYPLGGQYPQGLQDYRHLYKVYRADPQIQAAHENFAFIQLWDDHEFFNDCHQDYHEDTNPAGVTATTPQPALRKAANRAWSEYSVADVPYNPAKNWENSISLYRTFKFGNLMDLVVTDERLYRDGPPCGDLENQRYQTTGCPAQNDADRTMLGAAQKAWFRGQILGSTATWKLWANEVMLCQYLFGPPLAAQTEFFDLDQWDGYPAERAELLGAFKAAGVENFVALSGDAHLFLASYLRTDFNDTTEAPMGVELMVGAVSSGNYADAGVDANGVVPSRIPASAPLPAKKLAGGIHPLDTLEPFVLEYNPHMVFWNGASWGYGILTITPTNLVCEFKSPSTVKSDTSTLGTLATFTVPAGKVQLIQS